MNPLDTPTSTDGQPTDRSSRSKVGLAAGVAVGLVGGAAAGLILGVPGISGASKSDVVAVVQQTGDEPVDTTVDETETETGTNETGTDETDAEREVERGDRLREVLEPLVEDGTITAEQADAVTTHLVENRPEGRFGRGQGRGPRGGHGPGHDSVGGVVGSGVISDTVTELLGVDVETLRDELRDGATLSELAEANGVSTETLVDTLVAEAASRLDTAVENGRLDADRAADLESTIEERVTARVNGDFPRLRD